MMGALLFVYFTGMLFAWLVSYVSLLEDDHILTFGRTLLWPLYVIKLAAVAIFRAAKELAA